MKCAIPGTYGRKVPIESSTIRDDFMDLMIPEDGVGAWTPEKIKKELKIYWDQICEDREKLYISYGRGYGKKQFQDQTFKEYMLQLIQKDKEEHDAS